MASIADRIKALKLPARSLAFLIICAGGLLGFFLLVIYPYQASLAAADQEIKRLKSRIEEQKVLYPVFKDLLRKARVEETRGLPFPQKVKLARDDTTKLSTVFREIAQKSRLHIVDIAPQVDSLLDNTGFLRLKLDLQGDFFDLRNFLIMLKELPYFESLDQIQIRTAEGFKDIRLQIRLAQE